MTVYQNKLIVGGAFTDAGGLGTPYLASWNGTTWSDLGGTTNSIVQSLAVWNNKLIIGGYFTQCENLTASYIVQYDGNAFSVMGSGMGAQVMALTSYNGELYAGGFFTTAGGVSAAALAKWNGSAWSAVGNGVTGIVYSLGTYNGNLVVGGLFSAAGGVSANAIALYNGSTFSALGSGCGGGFYPYVFSVVSNGSDLYVGGLYTIAGGQTSNGIAKWNGSSWSTLGGGLWEAGNVYGAYGICVWNGELVATGIFNSPANNIAAWGTITGINNNQTVIDKFSLSQNYPNPFNPATSIQYSIPKTGFVKLVVFDALGREVETLVNKSQHAGTYEASFDGSKFNSGIYFYEITSGDFKSVKKMIMIK
jgi:hypothetical protein